MNRDRDDKTIIRVYTRAQVLLFRRTLLSSRSFLTYPTFSASFLPRTLGSCRVVAPLLLLPSPRLRFREPLSLSSTLVNQTRFASVSLEISRLNARSSRRKEKKERKKDTEKGDKSSWWQMARSRQDARRPTSEE